MDSGGTEYRSRQTIGDGGLLRNDCYVGQAVDKDPVPGDETISVRQHSSNDPEDMGQLLGKIIG